MPQYLVRRIATQNIDYIVTMSDIDPNFIGPVTDDNPASTVTPECEPGCELIEWAGSPAILSLRPSPTAALRWDGTGPAWIEVGILAAMISAAINQCYPDIDAVYADAIGNRAVEYTDAETDARAFAAAGYTGDTTPNVSSFALYNPTGVVQTNQWSADQIIARADAFKAAQVAMRAQRFDTQCAMRACTTPSELAHVVYLWNQFIATLRTQLGL